MNWKRVSEEDKNEEDKNSLRRYFLTVTKRRTSLVIRAPPPLSVGHDTSKHCFEGPASKTYLAFQTFLAPDLFFLQSVKPQVCS